MTAKIIAPLFQTLACMACTSSLLATHAAAGMETTVIDADLLVVGGTESGCAAAVQAARMGVKRIVLVNDIEWLGGQFSAEALGAIDENRAHGYDGTVPIPRSGIFREVIEGIEQNNAARFGGVRRPGNTRVITTSRPVHSQQVFQELLAPYERTRQLRRFSNYHVESVTLMGRRVTAVTFQSSVSPHRLTVRARMTIDASDWGDVIKGAGAEWDAGVDAKSDFDEPSAPESVEFSGDLNPITWCMIVEEQTEEALIPKPAGYDPRYFTGQWGWIDEAFISTARRLVHGSGFDSFKSHDVLLINSPPVDYPLDVYPADVAARLEATEIGASKKNFVALNPQQREIVFQDARRHSLKYLYYLQTKSPRFRRMALSNEFGTPDRLPPKPYIRESLRLVSQYIVREQDVLGFSSRSSYATAMFPDAVFSWQFELDFHPTRRNWTTDDGAFGPWEASFRDNRRFGRGGTGRCVFPVRSFVPAEVKGLLGAQKNLGYTSIVSSSCRLHDQSMHAGQACGAVAAVNLRHDEDPAEFYLHPNRLNEIRTALLEPSEGTPLVIWPFADVEPSDEDFAAIQQLALRRLFPMEASRTQFEPDEPATSEWIGKLASKVRDAGYAPPVIFVTRTEKRRNIANMVWRHIKDQPIPTPNRQTRNDADGDEIPDTQDPLPFTPGTASWTLEQHRDGRPDVELKGNAAIQAFDFTSESGAAVDGFQKDFGAKFSREPGYGWKNDLRANTRLRRLTESLLDGFVFTRKQDVWECTVPNGRYRVCACVGDAGYPQPGQNLTIEGATVLENQDTAAGSYFETTTEVEVTDGRLTVTIGTPRGGSNTTLNWIVIEQFR